MTWLVVRDDDTLRNRLAQATHTDCAAFRGGECNAFDQADAALAVLRDVGTPATTEVSPPHVIGPRRTRLVTDWTEAQP